MAERRAVLAVALGLFAAALPFSIAAAQIALTLAVLAWLTYRVGFPDTPLTRPALAYAGWSLVGVVAADQPLAGLVAAKQLLLLLILFVIPAARATACRTALSLFLASAAFSSLLGLLLYGSSPGGLEFRARGPFGHYMAFAGVLMLALVAALSHALKSDGRLRQLAIGATLPVTCALAVTYARNAWLGAIAGALAVCLRARPRVVPAAITLTAIVLALAPARLQARFISSFDVGANLDRVELVSNGVELIREHPWTGVGLDRVGDALAARGLERRYPHLHNTPLQIAAERGLPALAAWLWLQAAVVGVVLRRGGDPASQASGLGAVVALLVAGLFEYNFGDSEVQMTFLLLAALAARNDFPTAAAEPVPQPPTTTSHHT